MKPHQTKSQYKPLPWWKKPSVILGNHYDFGRPNAVRRPTIERDPPTIERMVRWKREAGFDTEFLMLNHSYLEGTGGKDPRDNYFKNFHGYREDWLGKYRSVRLPRSAQSVQLALAGQKARSAVNGNVVSFVIPRIGEYEMAIIR